MKKKIIALIMICVIALSAMTACGKKNSGSKDNAGSNTLKVGMEIGYPPFEYFAEDGKTPIGVDVEMATAIGEAVGMKIEFVDTAWAGIFAGLEKGDYDCIISAVTVTPERLLDFIFTDTYIENYQCIVTLKTAENKPSSMAALAGLKVAYQEETSSDSYLADIINKTGLKVETFEYPKVMQCFTELEIKRVDAILCDSTVAQSYMREGSIYEVTWTQEGDPEKFAICIKKGNTDLQSKLNAGLKKIKDNGKLQQILDKYF